MIDGKTVVCGLIGDPVEHTLSRSSIIRWRRKREEIWFMCLSL